MKGKGKRMGALPDSVLKLLRILCDNCWVTKERGVGECESREMLPYQVVERTFD